MHITIPIAFAVLTASLTAQDWVKRELTAWSYYSVAYDAARERAVLFGGGRNVNETWEWDGQTWTQRFPATVPPGRYEAAMVWDPVRQVVLMFGGELGVTEFTDTWEWDGVDWTERQTTMAPSLPTSPTFELAWDEARNEAVFVGNGTWIWDGSDWSQRATTTQPNADFPGFSMCWDGNSGGVLFAGTGPSGFETWLWDGSDWAQQSPATIPNDRQDASMAWDPSRNRIVLCGGARFSFPVWLTVATTYEWNGTDWVLGAPNNSAVANAFAPMWYDAQQGVLLRLGGESFTSTEPALDIWGWDGTTWQRTVEDRRPAASIAAMAYDSTAEETVLVNENAGSTWLWDGTSWSESAGVPYSGGARMAYDPARDTTWMFGGSGPLANRLFARNGGTWSLVEGTGFPPGRAWHGMAFDSVRSKLVVFGGSLRDDTWEWDGSTWTQLNPASAPSPRTATAMAFDAARGVTILFGGDIGGTFGEQNDTWQWDGTDWTQLFPATSPPRRQRAAMTYDAGRQRIVLNGGFDANNVGTHDDLWEWDGTDWIEITPSNPPTKVHHAALVFDARRNTLVRFGGHYTPPQTASGGPIDEIWERPANQASTSRLGAPCSGPMVPTLDAFGLPRIGDANFGLDLVNAAPTAATLFGFAGSSLAVPLGGCTWYLGTPIVSVPATTNGAGFASLGIPIPAEDALVGATLVGQAFTLDATAPIGVSFTAAIESTVGW